MKKHITLLIMLFSMIHSTTGQTKSDLSSLKGTWEYNDGYNRSVLKFIDDTKLIYDGEQSVFSLTTSPAAIRVYDDYGYYDYLYTLRGNKLTVTFPDGNIYVFVKVKDTPQTAQNVSKAINGNLYGSFCHWSGSSGVYSSSSYSSTDRISFDGKGNFIYGTETSFSSDAGLYSNDDNNSQRGTYSVEGNNIYITFTDGSKYTLQVYVQQDWGEITEIKYGEKVYAKQLCE